MRPAHSEWRSGCGNNSCLQGADVDPGIQEPGSYSRKGSWELSLLPSRAGLRPHDWAFPGRLLSELCPQQPRCLCILLPEVSLLVLVSVSGVWANSSRQMSLTQCSAAPHTVGASCGASAGKQKPSSNTSGAVVHEIHSEGSVRVQVFWERCISFGGGRLVEFSRAGIAGSWQPSATKTSPALH